MSVVRLKVFMYKASLEVGECNRIMVRIVTVKSVLNKHRRRDEWFLDDYSLNPYYGCKFNCIYCYTRSSKYGGSWKGLAIKINAPIILEKELSRYARRGKYGFIALSSATEPWMIGIEDKYKVTRKCLHIILRYRYPIHCLTKSTLILRDLDLLREIDRNARLPPNLKDKLKHGVLITFSLSTLDKGISRIFEPGAPSPKERLKALEKIRDKDFLTGIAFIPILPFITDHELEDMAREARELNCDYVFFAPLTLYGESKRLYLKVIEEKFPELLTKYNELYRNRFSPPKWYTNRFYRKALEYTRKYGLRFGIIKINFEI